MVPLRQGRRSVAIVLCAVSFVAWTAASSSADPAEFTRPPEAIAASLEAPAFPEAFLSPARDVVLLATPERFPPVAELARRVHLAGSSIDPLTNLDGDTRVYDAYQLVRIADGALTEVPLPPATRVSAPSFRPDGSAFAFASAGVHGTTLAIVTTATGALRSYPALHLDAALGDAVHWLPGGALLLHVLDTTRQPTPPSTGDGPTIRETSGVINRTPSGGLDGADRGAGGRFAYYARGSYVVLDPNTNRLTPLVEPGIYADARPSPDGKLVAFEAYSEPLSDAVPWRVDAHRTVAVDRFGRVVASLPLVPLGDNPGANGPPAGPRDIAWAAHAPETLVWVETGPVGHDTVFAKEMRGAAPAQAVLAIAGRLDGLAFIEGTSLALAHEYRRDNRTQHTVEFDVQPSRNGMRPEAFGSFREGDAFDDPGAPLERPGGDGEPVVIRDGGAIFLGGEGYTTAGLRPFVDRIDLSAHSKERLFQSSVDPLESVVAMLDDHGDAFLVRRQSRVQPPDLFVRRIATHELRQLTHFVDPAPALRTLHPRVVSYTRADGVRCSFTLYLPPDAPPGTRLPTLLWAYPFEFDDPAAASQNANFPQSFDEPNGPAARLLALAGYAVLDDVSMPIVGRDAASASGTLVEQLTMDARAAIDEAVRLGVTDRARVAVGGHSYGAFMAATLLAHTHLFRAGIARSGAYNRTLTPFGFQNESRTYWEAPDTYARLSPFAYANAITAPLLLFHGGRDDNTATTPIQSVRLYDAIRGNGGTARLVLFPDEGHAYESREAVETTEAEMIGWLNRYLAP